MDKATFVEEYTKRLEENTSFANVFTGPGHLLPSIAGLQQYDPVYVRDFTQKEKVWVSTFFRGLNRAMANTLTREEDLNDPNVGYCFPDSADVRRYCDGLDPTDHNGQHANASRDCVETWLSRLLDEEEDENFTIVAGKVGSGKTTFVKYMVHGLASWFQSRKVIVVPIFFRDWRQTHSRTAERFAGNEDDRLTFIIDRIFLRTICQDPLIVGELGAAAFRDAFLRARKLDYRLDMQHAGSGASALTEEHLKNLAENDYALLMGILQTWRECQASRLDPMLLMHVYRYLVQLGYRILVVYDGLDQISIGGINEGAHSGIFKAVSERVLNSPCHALDSSVPLKFVLTFRLCTCAVFRQAADTSVRSVDPLGLVPVDIKNILATATRRYAREAGEEKIPAETAVLLEEFIIRLAQLSCRAFDASDLHQLTKDFNSNIRELLNYFFQLTLYITNSVLGRGCDNVTTLVKRLLGYLAEAEQGTRRLKTRNNAFRRVFMLRDKRVFENYYAAGVDIPHTFDTVNKTNDRRGFIDNAFNYSQHFQGEELHPLLFTIRLLQFLEFSDYQPEQVIIDALGALGYRCNASSVLRQCCGAGLVKVRAGACRLPASGHKPDCDYLFNITGLGKLLLRSFATDVRYIEYVIQRALWPMDLLRHLDMRYMENLSSWMEAASLNLFVLYKYVTWIEAQERYKAVASLQHGTGLVQADGSIVRFLTEFAGGGGRFQLSTRLKEDIIKSCAARIFRDEGGAGQVPPLLDAGALKAVFDRMDVVLKILA